MVGRPSCGAAQVRTLCPWRRLRGTVSYKQGGCDLYPIAHCIAMVCCAQNDESKYCTMLLFRVFTLSLARGAHPLHSSRTFLSLPVPPPLPLTERSEAHCPLLPVSPSPPPAPPPHCPTPPSPPLCPAVACRPYMMVPTSSIVTLLHTSPPSSSGPSITNGPASPYDACASSVYPR